MLALSVLQFTCHAHLTSTATTSSSRRTKPAAAAAAVAVPHTGYTLPAQQQQHWVNKTLPLALQHILACYCQLTGSTDSSGSSGSSSSSNPSAGASSSLGCTREHGSSCPSPAGATSSDNRGWKAASLGGISSCMLLPSPKQQSAADQVRCGGVLAGRCSLCHSGWVHVWPVKLCLGGQGQGKVLYACVLFGWLAD